MLALDNAGSGKVKAFAQSMIDEYGKLGQQIEKMASDMKVPWPKTVKGEHANAGQDRN